VRLNNEKEREAATLQRQTILSASNGAVAAQFERGYRRFPARSGRRSRCDRVMPSRSRTKQFRAFAVICTE
jgi:hypothetical protein